MLNTCSYCGGSPVEYEGLCASCRSQIRKEARMAAKPRKVYRIPKMSAKAIVETKTYKQLRKEYLAKHQYCRAALDGCTKQAVEIHHLSKRGSKLNAEDTFMAVCRNCHHLIETKLSARERREKGLLK